MTFSILWWSHAPCHIIVKNQNLLCKSHDPSVAWAAIRNHWSSWRWSKQQPQQGFTSRQMPHWHPLSKIPKGFRRKLILNSLTLGISIPRIDVAVIHVHDEHSPVIQEVTLVAISLEQSRTNYISYQHSVVSQHWWSLILAFTPDIVLFMCNTRLQFWQSTQDIYQTRVT